MRSTRKPMEKKLSEMTDEELKVDLKKADDHFKATKSYVWLASVSYEVFKRQNKNIVKTNK